jgi:DNA-binding MarR family transcriptional regulator
VSRRTGAERSLSFLLARAGFESARRLRERLAPHGIEPRHFALLHELALADAIGIPKSGMVQLVDDLEGRGLLERRRSDRRTHALHITRAGADFLRGTAGVALEHDADLAAPLSEAERKRLVALLAKLVG